MFCVRCRRREFDRKCISTQKKERRKKIERKKCCDKSFRRLVSCLPIEWVSMLFDQPNCFDFYKMKKWMLAGDRHFYKIILQHWTKRMTNQSIGIIYLYDIWAERHKQQRRFRRNNFSHISVLLFIRVSTPFFFSVAYCAKFCPFLFFSLHTAAQYLALLFQYSIFILLLLLLFVYSIQFVLLLFSVDGIRISHL